MDPAGSEISIRIIILLKKATERAASRRLLLDAFLTWSGRSDGLWVVAPRASPCSSCAEVSFSVCLMSPYQEKPASCEESRPGKFQ